MLYGERVLTAMAYTILKVHKVKLLRMKDMDQITEFLQTILYKNFGYDDDTVIKALQLAMFELKKLNLDKLPPAPVNEFPKVPFGQFIEPSLEAKVGSWPFTVYTKIPIECYIQILDRTPEREIHRTRNGTEGDSAVSKRIEEWR